MLMCEKISGAADACLMNVGPWWSGLNGVSFILLLEISWMGKWKVEFVGILRLFERCWIYG